MRSSVQCSHRVLHDHQKTAPLENRLQEVIGIRRLYLAAWGLADRLEAENLIVRSPGTDDRRKVYIALTPHDDAMIEKLSALHHEELLRLIPQLQSLMGRIGRLSGEVEEPSS